MTGSTDSPNNTATVFRYSCDGAWAASAAPHEGQKAKSPSLSRPQLAQTAA